MRVYWLGAALLAAVLLSVTTYQRAALEAENAQIQEASIRRALYEDEQVRRKAELERGMALIRQNGYIRKRASGAKPRALSRG